jgi:hypothetical protein
MAGAARFATRDESWETIGANLTTTGRSFDAIFGAALQLLKSPVKELKFDMTGKNWPMIDKNSGIIAVGTVTMAIGISLIAAVGMIAMAGGSPTGDKTKLRSISQQRGGHELARLSFYGDKLLRQA